MRGSSWLLAVVLTLAACTSAAPSASLVSVAEMLPTTLDGTELTQTQVDTAAGATARLARLVGRTPADVESASRVDSPPAEPSKGFVSATRIAGVSGDRLLTAQVELVREQLESESQALSSEVISLGGKQVTQLAYPGAPEPMYLYVARDTLFMIGDAQSSAAAELLAQLP